MPNAPAVASPDSQNLIDNIALHPTPEGLMLSLMPAGLMPRLSAWMIDFGIRMILIIILGIISAFFGTAGTGLLAIGYFLVTWLYPVYFEVYREGMTPGKKRQGIYVCHDDGTPISLQSSMIRNLLRVADFLPMGFAAGALTIMFTRQSQRIGDIVAGTLVVYQQQDDIEKLYKSIYGLIAQQPSAQPIAQYKTNPANHSNFNPSNQIPNQTGFDLGSPLFFYPLKLNEQQALVAFTERLGFLSEARQQEIAIALAPLVNTYPHSPDAKKQAIKQAIIHKAMLIQGQDMSSQAMRQNIHSQQHNQGNQHHQANGQSSQPTVSNHDGAGQ